MSINSDALHVLRSQERTGNEARHTGRHYKISNSQALFYCMDSWVTELHIYKYKGECICCINNSLTAVRMYYHDCVYVFDIHNSWPMYNLR